MAPRSSIKKDPRIQKAVDEALANGDTIEEIAERVKGDGISRSAVGRYASKYRPLIEETIRFKAVAKANRVATLTDDAVLAASQRLPVAVWRQVESITERFTMRGREGDNTLIYVLDQGDDTYLFVRMVRTAPDANLAIRDTSIEPAEGIDALFASATDIVDRRS